MQLSDFNYQLPQELIALYPQERRSSSRLLYLDGMSGRMEHLVFSELPRFINPEDLLVFNNTRVIPARLFGYKETGGKVELLIERVLNEREAICQIRASKPPRAGMSIIIGDSVRLTVAGREDEFYRIAAERSIHEILQHYGHMPLPPYIDREDEGLDRDRYQTVYAQVPGAVAAPTAGLHFDETLLQQLNAKGVATAEVTLHVGAGTFQPVRAANIEEHHMHSELVEVSEAVCEQVLAARARGGRVIAVGTTSVRSLESAALAAQQQGKTIAPYRGDTNIFIYPGFRFRCVDMMITNFHLPESTLLMLVSAFATREHVFKAYREAIEQKYRFFSYGDAMLLSKAIQE